MPDMMPHRSSLSMLMNESDTTRPKHASRALDQLTGNTSEPVETSEPVKPRGPVNNVTPYDDDCAKDYPLLGQFTHPVKPLGRNLVGRDNIIRIILASFLRPELCNVILLAAAGAGKTAIVQGTMEKDPDRLYLEVDLATMVKTGNAERLAADIKSLFGEVIGFVHDHDRELVLFIDEFHQIVQESPAAVEALKPILADSGTRGVRVIAATTNIEFRKFIAPNQPLVERLQRIALPEADEELTVKILKDMAKKNRVDDAITDDEVYHMIYETSNRFNPTSWQPRKSLLLLDSMIGWNRMDPAKYTMDKKLIAQVLHEQYGVDIDVKVNALSIREKLDESVFDQPIATRAIEQALQNAVAHMNDPDKPMATLLFTGSTGVGKTEASKAMAKLLFNDTHSLIRFDMSEFANPESMERFRSELTANVWAKPYSVLLLDEIEKSCPEVTRLLLQVLDDGRLVDSNNRVVTFVNTYIIMTTNGGAEAYEALGQYDSGKESFAMFQHENIKLIRQSLINSKDNKFPPELLGRVGQGIILFRPLSHDTKVKILLRSMNKVVEHLDRIHHMELTFDTDDIVQYVFDEIGTSSSMAGGAREVVSMFETSAISKISTFANLYPDSKRVHVYVRGTMRSEDITTRFNKATLGVYDPDNPERNLDAYDDDKPVAS